MERYIPWMGKVASLVLGLTFLLSAELFAQEITKISYTANGVLIEDAIQQIGDQNGFTYSYNPSLFEGYPRVYGTFRNKIPEYIFQSLIDNPAIGIKRMGNTFIFFAKQPNEVNLEGFVKDFRSKELITEVRLAVANANVSTTSNATGNYQLKYSTYNDSLKLYIFHKDYEEQEVYVKSESVTLNFELVPLPKYYDFLPHVKYQPDEISTASIEDNFIFKALVAEEVAQASSQPISADSSAGFFLNDSVKTPFYSIYQVGFVPPLNNHGLRSGWAINNFSFNVFSGYGYGLEGIEFASFINILKKDMSGLQVAGFGNFIGGEVFGIQSAGFFNTALNGTNGIQSAGFINVSRKYTNGAQFAGFTNISGGNTYGIQAAGFSNTTARNFGGIQVSGFHNTTAGSFYGVQGAGFINTSARKFYGVQAAGFLNVHAGKFNGIQAAGFANISGNVNGIQAAPLLNVGMKVNGIQLGLINYSDSINGLTIGMLNIVRHGLHKFELAYNELGMASLTFKTGSYGFHNNFYAALEAVEGRKEWGVGYGFGTMLFGRRKVQIGFNTTSIQLSQNGKFYNGVNLLNRASFSLGFDLVKGVDLFFAPSFNLLVREPQTQKLEDATIEIAPFRFNPQPFGESEELIQSWIGFEAGIRF